MGGQPAEWYLRRLKGMSPSEVTWRVVDKTRQQTWRRRQVTSWAGSELPSRPHAPSLGCSPQFEAVLPFDPAAVIPDGSAGPVIAAADRVLQGHWDVLGVTRKDLNTPDWFLDPVTGRRAPQTDYCFSINYRSEAVTGNIKQVWELSRFQHVNLLASAYAVSRRDVYAEAAAVQLRSWWEQNPFLSGVHWTSGIDDRTPAYILGLDEEIAPGVGGSRGPL